ncbi:MAG: hypothetical protein ACTSX9_03850 [Candidatus Njordarchaeales archaeon]
MENISQHYMLFKKKALEALKKGESLTKIAEELASMDHRVIPELFRKYGSELGNVLCKLLKNAKQSEKRNLIDAIVSLSGDMPLQIVFSMADCLIENEDFSDAVEYIRSMLNGRDSKEVWAYVQNLLENRNMSPILAKVIPALTPVLSSKQIIVILETLGKNLPESAYKWYIRAIAELSDFIGIKNSLEMLSRVLIVDKVKLLRYSETLLATAAGLYKLYITSRDIRSQIVQLIRSFFSEERFQRILLRGAMVTVDHLEVAAVFWTIKMVGNPEKYYDLCLASIIRATRIHGDRVFVEASDLLETLLKREGFIRVDLLKKLSRSKYYRIRELAALAASKIVRNHREVIEILWRLCYDKRSSVRKLAVAGILEILDELRGDEYKRSVIALLASKYANAARLALLSLLNKREEVGKDFVRKILKKAVKDPRSAILKSLIEVLSFFWNYLSIEELGEILGRIAEFSRDRKEIIESLTMLIESIVYELSKQSDRDSLDVLKKYLVDSKSVPVSLRKRFARIIERETIKTS